MPATRRIRSFGKPRACLLLFLLSSGEALSVYGSVSVAASVGSDRRSGERQRDAQSEERGPAAKAFGALKALFSRTSAAAAAKGAGQDSETCRTGGGSALSVAAGFRGGHSHHHGAGATLSAAAPRTLGAIKLISMFALTTLNVFCWLLPLKVKRFTESKAAISIANAFSGGVFLSLAFGHMLPHAAHGFRELGYADSVPYFVTLGGYMLIFFVEKVAFDAHNVMHDATSAAHHALDHHQHAHHHSNGNSVSVSSSSTSSSSSEKAKQHPKGSAGTIAAAVAPASGGGGSSGRSALILLGALSVHSVFETMALGLADTNMDVGLLGLSIALHTPAEAIALLVSFLRSGLSEKSIILYLGLFSCVAPIGVILGMFVNEFAGKLADAALVALTAGTFFYVGATEVVAEEFESPDNRWVKFLALLVGMGGIAAITTYTEGGHG